MDTVLQEFITAEGIPRLPCSTQQHFHVALVFLLVSMCCDTAQAKAEGKTKVEPVAFTNKRGELTVLGGHGVHVYLLT